MKSKEMNELTESRDWCQKNGYVGFLSYYNDILAYHEKRAALPEREFSSEDDSEFEDSRD